MSRLRTFLLLPAYALIASSVVLAVAPAADAAFAGANGPIVFASYRPAQSGPNQSNFCSGVAYVGSSELWIYDPSSGNTTQLTCTGQLDQHPFASPDGTRVVFSSTRGGGNPLLYTVPLSTAVTTAVAPTLVSANADGSTTNISDDYPSWSPANDGTIVFQRTIQGGAPQLWTENVSSSTAATPIFASPTGYSDTQPVYDPLNANIILFTRSIGGVTQIFQYNLSTPTVAPVNLSNSTSNDSKPDFAPFAGSSSNPTPQRIVFQSDRACGSLQLFTMKPDGSNQLPVFQTWSGGVATGLIHCQTKPDENPVFSPDATAIAFDSVGNYSQDVFVSMQNATVALPTTVAAIPVDVTPNFSTDNQPNWAPLPIGNNLPESPDALALPAVGGVLLAGFTLAGRRKRRAVTSAT